MTFFQKRARTKLFVPAFLVASGAALLHAQRPQGGPVGDLVIDFVALDASGQPVAGLQPGDVSIKIAGKVRTVTGVELKRFDAGGAAPAASAPAAAPSAAPPPFSTNAGGGASAAASTGRTVMIVVDQDSLRAGSERAIVASLEPFLKTLTPADRVAFHTTPRDTANAGFGSGLAGVRAALAKFGGQKAANSSGNDNICRSSDTLQQLRSMMEGLPVSDRPTTMVFFGSGLSIPAKTSSSASTTCEVTNDHYRALAQSVALTRVNMTVVQGDESVTGRDDGLENLAGVTSAGPVLRVTGPALGRLNAETASYYVATVKPESDDRPGQTQRLELKVNKEGVSTRSRNDVAFTRSTGPGAGAAGAAAKPGSVSAADMLRTQSSYSDLQLRATSILSRGPAGKVAILTLVEPADPSVKLKELTAGVVDMGVTPNRIFPVKADEKQMAARPIAIPMSADAGKIKVRVAAVDESGKGGAVDVEVSTDLATGGPVKLGGIMLLAPRGTSFSPQMTFSAEEEVGVYFELYGDVSKGIEAKVEIAATPDGPALETTKPGGQQTSEPDKFILNAKLPIAKLAPGDYVVRGIVNAAGQPPATVYRTLRKVAK